MDCLHATCIKTGTPDRENLRSIPIFHASLLCGGLFERNVMLRGERPQAARDDRDRAEFGPGCVHHIGGGGALLAQKSVLTIPTLQIVLCAGYGDLHCFPGQRTVPLRTQSTGSHERLSSWEGVCSSFNPSWLPLPGGAVRGVPAAGRLHSRESGRSGCGAGQSPGHQGE